MDSLSRLFPDPAEMMPQHKLLRAALAGFMLTGMTLALWFILAFCAGAL